MYIVQVVQNFFEEYNCHRTSGISPQYNKSVTGLQSLMTFSTTVYGLEGLCVLCVLVVYVTCNDISVICVMAQMCRWT